MWRSALAAAATFSGVAMLGGGWWWVHNVMRYGRLQPAGHKAERTGGPLPLSETFGDFVGHFVGRMPGRFWAMLSVKSFDDPGFGAFPWRFSAALSVLLLAVLLATYMSKWMFGANRADRGVLLLPGCLVFLILFASTWSLYARTGTPAGVQGRYLFVGLPGVFVVVALALGWWTRDRVRPAVVPSIVAVLSLVFVGASLHRAATFHWGVDRHSMSGVTGAIVAWSPLPRAGTLVVAGFFIVALAGLLLSLFQGWSGGEGGGGAPSAVQAETPPTAGGAGQEKTSQPQSRVSSLH